MVALLIMRARRRALHYVDVDFFITRFAKPAFLFRFATKGDSLIPLDASYLRTLGSHLISFYDIKMLNDHYSCNGEFGF